MPIPVTREAGPVTRRRGWEKSQSSKSNSHHLSEGHLLKQCGESHGNLEMGIIARLQLGLGKLSGPEAAPSQGSTASLSWGLCCPLQKPFSVFMLMGSFRSEFLLPLRFMLHVTAAG